MDFDTEDMMPIEMDDAELWERNEIQRDEAADEEQQREIDATNRLDRPGAR